MSDKQQTIVLVAVGGATCSGKTSLAKHLAKALPDNTIIVHQDDFAPPQEQIPYHPDYPDVQDWDAPRTAIDWPRFREALAFAKRHGRLPPDVNSHDHLNVQREVPVSDEATRRWAEKLKEVIDQLHGDVTIVLVDGFLLYWDKACAETYDVSLFLRVPHDVLKARREERQQYVTQTGDVWVDPPHYFERVVYPAYVEAHKHLFADEDVENGPLVDSKRLIQIQPAEGPSGMSTSIETGLQAIYDELKGRLVNGGRT